MAAFMRTLRFENDGAMTNARGDDNREQNLAEAIRAVMSASYYTPTMLAFNLQKPLWPPCALRVFAS